MQARSCLQQFGSKGGRVYFLHNRKAGGTTLRRWLSHLVCKGKCIGVVNERLLFPVSYLLSSRSKGTVFLTALRDPIDRIKSLYLFAGSGRFTRWIRSVQIYRQREKEGYIWMEIQVLF